MEKKRDLGAMCTIRLRGGQLSIRNHKGDVVRAFTGPHVTLELAVVEGAIEVVSGLETRADGVSELWPFDDVVPAANTKDAAVTNEELVALERLLKEAL